MRGVSVYVFVSFWFYQNDYCCVAEIKMISVSATFELFCLIVVFIHVGCVLRAGSLCF